MEYFKNILCCQENTPVLRKNETPKNHVKLINLFEVLDYRYLVRDFGSDDLNKKAKIIKPYHQIKTKTSELIAFFESMGKKP